MSSVAQKWLEEHYGTLGSRLSKSIGTLTDTQKRFCESYIRCGSAAQAARDAGMSTQNPALLLHAPHIAGYLNILAAKAEHDLGRASTKELLDRVKSTPVLTADQNVLPPALLREIEEQFEDDKKALSDADEEALLENIERGAEPDFGIMQVPPVKMLINQTFGPEWIMEQLVRVAERCLQIEPVYDKKGRPIGEFNFNASGALKSLELLGKTMAMFTEKIDVGDLSKREPSDIDHRIQALMGQHPDLAKIINNGIPALPDKQH